MLEFPLSLLNANISHLVPPDISGEDKCINNNLN